MESFQRVAGASAHFPVRVGTLPTGVRLDFELYVQVPQGFRSLDVRGKTLPDAAMIALQQRFGETLFVVEADRGAYLRAVQERLARPHKASVEELGAFVKETALVHVHDLFTRDQLGGAVGDVGRLLEELVDLASSDVSTTATLLKLSVHDYYTYNHCVNVAAYAISFAKRIFGNDRRMLLAAGLGGLLHDIGKRSLPWQTINKPGALSPEEWHAVRRHPELGASALDDVDEISHDAKLVVLEHHEAFNGSGYPRGLSGEAISILARVVTIADVFDALTTNRSYHRAVGPADAMAKMFAMQPGKFDPELFKAFRGEFRFKNAEALHDDFDPCTPQPLLKRRK